ncbi:MAG: hydroxyneurosporene methyltransferase, partial [Chloroflexi bacterium]|nr:hydroxyneurosporene methyltransferase [Chloroflexota bacterium]
MNLEALTDLCTPWCVHVVVTLRIAEHLAEGPRAISDLACAATCDADALARVLRHLIARGLFDEPSIDVFAANEAARGLTTPAARIGLD